jgi:hypothetical protein
VILADIKSNRDEKTLKNGRAEESLRKTKIKIIWDNFSRDCHYDFSRDGYKRCSAEMVKSVVQLRCLKALFSRDGFRRCSAEMATSFVQQRWLQALFSRDVFRRSSAEIVKSIIQQRWLQTLFSRNDYKRCSAEMVTSVDQ